MNNTIKFENFDVGFSPLEEGFQPEPKVLVFRNQQTWDKFWASSSFMDVNLQKLPAPDVNFEQNMVIALTPGSQPTGGYDIHVDRITQSESPLGKKWVVHYTETVPDSSCLVTQQPTTPTVFILTEQSAASVELAGQSIPSPCSN